MMFANSQIKLDRWRGAGVLAFLLAVCGCEPQGGRPPERIPVALVGVAESDPLWPVIRNGGLRAQRDFGLVDVTVFCPPTPDPELQADILRQVREGGFHAACVQVADPDVIRPVLEELRAAGIFVVTLGRPLNADRPFHHCGADEYEVGQALADTLAKSLDGRGTIAVLAGPDADEGGPISERLRGFRQRMDAHAGVEILREIPAARDSRAACAQMRKFCERFPRLDGAALISDAPLANAEAWSEPIAPAGCKVVGVGPFPATWPLLSRRWCYALIGADYDQMSYKAVQWCIVVARQGDLPPQSFSVPVHAVWFSGLESWQDRWHRWCEPVVLNGE